MALSRFWVALFLCSIAYLLIQLFSGRFYSIEFAVSGKKDDPLLQREYYIDKLPPELQSSLQSAPDHKVTVGKEQYAIDNGVVKVYAGKQAADGVVPQCKNTLFDILLPLAAYLAFFTGLMQLLIDSGAAERVAKLLSPIFVHVFPEVPRGHPSISYMTLNFAANFLGLDSAATPFGLKAMKSLQELNEQKDRASNPQIMFMCLHAAGSDRQKLFHGQPLERGAARPYLCDFRLQLVAREAIRRKGHHDLQVVRRRRIQRAGSRAHYFPVYPRHACRDLAFPK